MMAEETRPLLEKPQDVQLILQAYDDHQQDITRRCANLQLRDRQDEKIGARIEAVPSSPLKPSPTPSSDAVSPVSSSSSSSSPSLIAEADSEQAFAAPLHALTSAELSQVAMTEEDSLTAGDKGLFPEQVHPLV
jgi:hypothetical protein